MRRPRWLSLLRPPLLCPHAPARCRPRRDTHSTYGFSTGIGGLAYIGLGVGFLISALFGAKFGDAAYRHLSKKHNNGKGKPEYRVPVLIVGSFFVPIGIL